MDEYSVLLGAAFGFGASITPDIFALIQARMQHQHTITEKTLELEAAKVGHKFALKTTQTESATRELEALLTHDSSLRGNAFIENMRASVRPVVTYLFMLLFVLVKLCFLFNVMWYQQVPITLAIPLLWDAETMSIFAAVLSFWFGARAMKQFRTSLPQNSLPHVTTAVRPRYRNKPRRTQR